MSAKRRLMAVLAHPDDESLGVGGTLAKYASEGVDVCLVTATRGDAGRFRGYRSGEDGHPGPAAVASTREGELRAAAAVLGLREVSVLGHRDAQLDRADPREVVGQIVADVRKFRPDVVVTFGPDGAYGHPDHIAISQFTTAAMVAAADASFLAEGAAGGTTAFGVEALLHRLAEVDVDCLSVGAPDAVRDRRWRRTPGDAMAGLGHHDRD